MSGAAGTVQMSQLSLQFLTVPVQAFQGGTAYNPTGGTVQFAFVDNPGSLPTSGQWVNGSWFTVANYNYPYSAQCLVGPGGATAPTAGTYNVWLKIFAGTEIPVLIAGQLQIV